MNDKYVPQEVEPKWQKRWQADGLYEIDEDPGKEQFYFLTMYPYPSGDLHIGHWYAMAPSDAKARYLRMQGYNVLFPMGFDAFGLPAENAAIERDIHPYEWTMSNIDNMREQLRSMGPMFDWSRQVVTCEPEYYEWNQWFFLKMYEMGLAYRTEAPVDWCPSCNTSLAREQVVGEERLCERCDTPVTRKDLEQWLLKITDYADELLDGLRKIDWPERVKTMQRNWIGRSEGATIVFKSDQGDHIRVFTTRPDTVYGATFMVLAPEHPLVRKLTTPDRHQEVHAYVEQARRETEIERQAVDREKTGVFIGAYAVNPLTKERIPIFVGDYVLMSYGSGAIMGVPAHDQRDFDFAKKHDLPIPVVIAPPGWDNRPIEEAFTGPGEMVNSERFDGVFSLGKYFAGEWAEMSQGEKGAFADEHGYTVAEIDQALQDSDQEGKAAIIEHLEEVGIGEYDLSYRLRDWLISRQRYWGTPIPIVYCGECGIVPVAEADLPVELPQDAEFRPTGQSPLNFHQGFLNTECPECGGAAQRETDTMDTFIDSSWYQYRYLSPRYEDAPFDPEAGEHWLPVDQYTGGVEHATMHLLYTRFWTKVMRDMGLVDFDEPMLRLFNQGIVLGPDGFRMSKSRGNVVDPDQQVEQYGADAVRTYLMFMRPWNEGGPWDPQGIQGVDRFLRRVWNLVTVPPTAQDGPVVEEELRELRHEMHKTIEKATEDMEEFAYNTMIAALMEYTNFLVKAKKTPVVHHKGWEEAIGSLLLMLAPIAPHLSEELWECLGCEYSIHEQSWPTWDQELAAEEQFTLVIQVDGKVRDKFDVSADISEERAKEMALASDNVKRHVNGRDVKDLIYVPGRLVNVVTE